MDLPKDYLRRVDRLEAKDSGALAGEDDARPLQPSRRPQPDRRRSRLVTSSTSAIALPGQRPWFLREVLRELMEDDPPTPDPALPSEPLPEIGNVPVFYAAVSNFDQAHRRAPVLHAIPWNDDDVVAIVEWARDNDYRVRPLGNNHSWSPTTLGSDPSSKVVLVDLRRFRHASLDPSRGVATFGAGLTLEEASRFLRDRGYAFPWAPAAGEITIGGALALAAHGTGIGLRQRRGGSLSELVQQVEAVTASGSQYAVQTYRRSTQDADLSALLVHLGASVVLRASIDVVEEFACRTRRDTMLLSGYLGESVLATAANVVRVAFRRRELDVPRLKLDLRDGWGIELLWFPHQGILRRAKGLLVFRRRSERTDHVVGQLTEPYRDPLNFAIGTTDEAIRTALVKSRGPNSPLGQTLQNLMRIGSLPPPRQADAHATTFYVSRYILRFHAAGWCIIARKHDVSDVVWEIADRLQDLQTEHGRPLTGPVEVRVTDVDPDGPVSAALSPCRAVPWQTDATVAVWLNVLTDLTEQTGPLLHELERWLIGLRNEPDSPLVAVRPEWSKGWAYDGSGKPWSDVLARDHFRSEFAAYPQANLADVAQRLAKLDPDNVFETDFHHWVLRA